MLHLTDAFALLGISLVLCCGLLKLATSQRMATLPLMWVKPLTVASLAIVWVPLGPGSLPVVAYVRGICADLSITLIVFAAWHIGHHALGWRTTHQQERTTVMSAIAAAALFLYPASLGWGNWDAYPSGWGSWGMLLVLLVLCTVCLFRGQRVLPLMVALALLAWSMGLMESRNLWDYLIDPWLSIFALGFVFIKSLQFLFARFR